MKKLDAGGGSPVNSDCYSRASNLFFEEYGDVGQTSMVNDTGHTKSTDKVQAVKGYFHGTK